MKTTSILTLTTLLGLSVAPTLAQARPPWEATQQHDDPARIQLVDSRRDYSEYRYTSHEREALRQRLSHREFDSLPPGLQKKVARGGKLPPGCRKASACPIRSTTTASAYPHMTACVTSMVSVT
jgi:hypothetical protein